MANLIQVHDLQPNDLRDLIRSAIAEMAPTLPPVQQVEVIDRDTLCQRLAISAPTLILWEKKGKIPRMRIGGQYRYDWFKVLAAIECKPKK